MKTVLLFVTFLCTGCVDWGTSVGTVLDTGSLPADGGMPAPDARIVSDAFDAVDAFTAPDAVAAPDAGSDAGSPAAPLLRITLDPETPVGHNLVMGSADNAVFRIRLITGAENLYVTSLTELVEGLRNVGGIWNVRILNAADRSFAGGTLATLASDGSGTHNTIPFLTLAHDTTTVLEFSVDVTTYVDGAISGDAFRFTASETRTDGSLAVTALTWPDGRALTADDIIVGDSAVDERLTGNWFTMYRTVLSVLIDRERPPSHFPGLESAGQVVARYTLVNSANAGSYSATVEYVSMHVASTIDAADWRSLSILWDTPTRPPVNIGGVAVPGGRTLTTDLRSGCRRCTSTLAIASGDWHLVVVTADTQDAASGDILRADLEDLRYSDGVSTDIVADVVPILGNELTY